MFESSYDNMRKFLKLSKAATCRVCSKSLLTKLLAVTCLVSLFLNAILFYRRSVNLEPSGVYKGVMSIVYDNWAAGLELKIETGTAGIQLKTEDAVNSESPTTNHWTAGSETTSKVAVTRTISSTKHGISRLETNRTLLVPLDSTAKENRTLGVEIKRRAVVTRGSPTTKHSDFKNVSSKIEQHRKPNNRSSESLTTLKGRLSACPLHPKGLVGPILVLQDKVTTAELIKTHSDIETGGRIRPKSCTSRTRLAVIIPFRNRHMHLNVLLNNLIPFLKKQMVDATLLVIEQAPPTTFNRGALLNIGFLEAEKIGAFDCFMFHDVDLIPMNDNIWYRCGQNPHHFAAAMSKNNFKLMYENYFGGVVGFSREQYLKINGNSNLYFGWGGEDDDLALRTTNKNYMIERYDQNTSHYLMIRHSRDKGNDKNSERRKIMSSAIKRQDIEGLNTTKYKVNSVTLAKLYTWINVSIDMLEILETAPDFTKRAIWKFIEDLKNVTKTSSDH